MHARALVVENFDELLAGSRKASGKARHSALALAPDVPFILLAPEAGHGLLGTDPRCVDAVVVPARERGLCSAALASEATMACLTDALCGASDVRVVFQVWSEGLEHLVRRLRSLGVNVDGDSLPLVAAQTVSYWNTKRGGRELLVSIPIVAECLPAAAVCADLDEVAELVGAASPDVAHVLKADVGLGGAGVALVAPGARDIESLRAATQRYGAKGKREVESPTGPGGWLVEELVGDPRTNVSPTADFVVHGADVELVGIGLQLLRDEVAYVGVRDVPVGAAYRDRCIALGGVVCEELARRGYRGPVNVDFVVTADGRVAVMEINVRQSAPLETFVSLRRRYGPDWTTVSYECESALPVGALPVDVPSDAAGPSDFVAIATDPAATSADSSITLLTASSDASRLALLRSLVRDAVLRDAVVAAAPPQLADVATEGSVGRQAQIALAKRMRGVSARFREQFPLGAPDRSTSSYAIPTLWGGVPATKVLAWFPSPGCAWSLAGGCTMCNFAADPASVSVEAAAAAFVEHLRLLDDDVKRMHLGPGGSFFDDREVPEALREAILKGSAALPSLRSVGVETRPSLVTSAKLMHAIECLPDSVVDLTLGFGLECLDPLIREVAVNKGYDTNHIDRAIQVIEGANVAQSRVRVDFEVYVLLKPLFLTEREAIDEAVRTIKWSFRRGATTVAMFMNTIKRDTVQGYLADRTDLAPPYRYESPYYRTAIEVLRQLPSPARRLTQVLGPQSGVMADGQPRGCPLCTPLMLGALMGFNFTRADEILEEAARSWCPCREAWDASLEVVGEPLPMRIDQGIALLEAAFPKSEDPRLARVS